MQQKRCYDNYQPQVPQPQCTVYQVPFCLQSYAVSSAVALLHSEVLHSTSVIAIIMHCQASLVLSVDRIMLFPCSRPT